MTKRVFQLMLLVVFALTAGAGCQKTTEPQFRLNQVEWLKQERLVLPLGEHFKAAYADEITQILLALFGTPNDPRFPAFANESADSDPSKVVDLEQLKMSAGPVSSDKEGTPAGLYREHCSHCHGISGDGAGPSAALLNPYPRDFRLGKFKFKSTPLRQPPTHDDLKRLLMDGIPGTAMPSFKLLSEQELDSLIDYVRYLTIRGQFERYLMSEMAALGGAPLLAADQTASKATDQQNAVETTALRIEQISQSYGEALIDLVARWKNAPQQQTKIPPMPAGVALDDPAHTQLVSQGRQLFFGKGNCMQCHGETGAGDGNLSNFDDWTSEWIKTTGIDPYDPETYQDFMEAGALPPRPIRPRNLQTTIFRGGDHSDDLFLRIANGIEGTPMPSSAALTTDEIWALVAYVKSLPLESATQ